MPKKGTVVDLGDEIAFWLEFRIFVRKSKRSLGCQRQDLKCTAQASFELSVILLLWFLQCWDYRQEPSSKTSLERDIFINLGLSKQRLFQQERNQVSILPASILPQPVVSRPQTRGWIGGTLDEEVTISSGILTMITAETGKHSFHNTYRTTV